MINGTEATQDGLMSYPVLKAEYKLQICNYNAYNGTSVLNFGAETPPRSFLKLWRSEPISNRTSDSTQSVSTLYVNKTYQPAEEGIEEGYCREIIDVEYLDSSYFRYYMEASLNGPLDIGIPNVNEDEEFCDAYSSDPIEFGYDYGDGKCEFEVSICLQLTCDPTSTMLGYHKNLSPFYYFYADSSISFIIA